MLTVHVDMSPCVHVASLLSPSDQFSLFILGIQIIAIKYLYIIFLIVGTSFPLPPRKPRDYDITLITLKLISASQLRHFIRFPLPLRTPMDWEIIYCSYSPLIALSEKNVYYIFRLSRSRTITLPWTLHLLEKNHIEIDTQTLHYSARPFASITWIHYHFL